MADNVTADAGAGGATFAADDIGGVHFPRTKLVHGADGTNAGDVAAGNPLPVEVIDVTNTMVADIGSIKTAVELIDNAISGTEMQVDVVGPLPAGTNAIGKLAANSGVDIGDVDVLSVIPGTGATNLGKAIDSVVGATDTGIATLVHHKEDLTQLSTADGDWDALSVDSLGQLHVAPEGYHVFDNLDATTGWSVLNDDAANLATTTNHVQGTAALTFDKVNGTANTVFAGIQKTLSSTNLGSVSLHDIIQGAFYIPDLTDVSYVFLRLGTDSSNYNEWRLDASLLTAAVWEAAALTIGDADFAGNTGTGLDTSAVTYIAVGVAFNAETDTLSGIVFDQISYHTNQHTSTSINSEVTSSINSANVNLSKVGGKVTNTEAGNVSTGTQRVTIATDDANLSAIKSAVELIDNAVSGSEMQVDVVGALPAGSNLVGDVGISGARTSGGTTLYKNIDVDESEDQVKGSAGQLYWINAINLTASVVYLKIYNATAASVTVGTTVPDLTFPVPTSGDTSGAGFVLQVTNGIAFSTAITIAATTGVADNDSGAPAANALVVNLGYA